MTAHKKERPPKAAPPAGAAAPVVVVDMDGTLADATRRERQFLTGEKKDWQGFFRDMESDPPIAAVLERVKELRRRYSIIILTGRPEKYRQSTETWLGRYGVEHARLVMRHTGDTRPDFIAKAELLDDLLREGLKVVLALDDREPVCDAYRARGVHVVQVSSNAENQLINEAYRLMEQ